MLDYKEKYKQAERKLRLYEGLFEANAAITSSLKREEVLRLVMEKARELLEMEAASIFLVDQAAGELVLEVSTFLPEKPPEEIRFPLGKGVAGWVAMNGEPVVTDDLTKHPQFYPGTGRKTGFNTRSYMCVPLKVGERIIGTAQVMNRNHPGSFDSFDLKVMEGFARQAAIALENSRLHEEELEKKRLEEELEQAHRIQSRLFPAEDPALENYDISGISIPCRWVGGDYFDYLKLPNGNLGLVIADVCGKGIPAAVLMSSAQAILHSLAEQNQRPNYIINNLNRYLCRNSSRDKFVSCFYGELDTSRHKFSYINAGHNPPIILRGDQNFTELKEGGMVLGVDPDNVYETSEITIEAGDLIILYTDGVTEVRSEDTKLFSGKSFKKTVSDLKSESSHNIIEQIYHSAKIFKGHQGLDDDFTLICVKRRI